MYTPEIVEHPAPLVRQPLSRRHPITKVLETQTPADEPAEFSPHSPAVPGRERQDQKSAGDQSRQHHRLLGWDDHRMGSKT